MADLSRADCWRHHVAQLRLSSVKKDAIKKAASACGRTVTEYLLECARLVALKLK